MKKKAKCISIMYHHKNNIIIFLHDGRTEGNDIYGQFNGNVWGAIKFLLKNIWEK